MSENRPNLPLSWELVESQLASISPVAGGFSLAKRGLVRLPGGETIFVKIGTEENSKRWAKKELAVYEYLNSESYPFIPNVLSEDPDATSFALDALLPDEGWDWSDTWTTDRLDATLEAMNVLAQLHPANKQLIDPEEPALEATRDGWKILVESQELQERLWTKLRKAGHNLIAEKMDLKRELERSSRFIFKTDTLVHYDIRADNCAWNPNTKEVKFVDWNWTQLGDTRIDTSAMLVNVQRSGFDVASTYLNRLDADALQWLAGFWLRGAATPIWEGGSESLRDFQLDAGIAAQYLLSQLESI